MESSHIPSATPRATSNTRPADDMEFGTLTLAPNHARKKFVLCFDGTGNKFSGTEADSNILKIYRMLDRNGDDQFHYCKCTLQGFMINTHRH
jgi:uncharacterized protein (DUF2235 family)